MKRTLNQLFAALLAATALLASGISMAATPCTNCGTVLAVKQIEQEGEGSGVGMVAGGVAGALLGSQVGKGTGKNVATLAGAAGGAYAGHQAEKYMKKTHAFEIHVRMNDGSERTVVQKTDPALRAGDRVKITENGVVRY